jgi:hypothetical protein
MSDTLVPLYYRLPSLASCRRKSARSLPALLALWLILEKESLRHNPIIVEVAACLTVRMKYCTQRIVLMTVEGSRRDVQFN